MINLKLYYILAILIIILVEPSCKKSTNAELDPELQQFNTDAGNYKAELDQADNDINNTFSNTSLGKYSGKSSPLCGATIDTSQMAQKILYLNFDGVTPCFSPSRVRGGQIKAQLTSGNKWSDKNSVLTLTFINYKVTILSNNKSITFNGVKTLKNLNGNNWIGFFLGLTTLKYQERALNMQVNFDNKSAVWNSARITEWKYTPKNTNPNIPYEYITFTGNGDTTINGISNIDSWGTNRFNYEFTTHYNQPITSNTYCGLNRFNAGELEHNVNNNKFTLTLGLDKNGNPTPLNCAYGFKVGWNIDGKANSVILSY